MEQKQESPETENVVSIYRDEEGPYAILPSGEKIRQAEGEVLHVRVTGRRVAHAWTVPADPSLPEKRLKSARDIVRAVTVDLEKFAEEVVRKGLKIDDGEASTFRVRIGVAGWTDDDQMYFSFGVKTSHEEVR